MSLPILQTFLSAHCFFVLFYENVDNEPHNVLFVALLYFGNGNGASIFDSNKF